MSMKASAVPAGALHLVALPELTCRVGKLDTSLKTGRLHQRQQPIERRPAHVCF